MGRLFSSKSTTKSSPIGDNHIRLEDFAVNKLSAGLLSICLALSISAIGCTKQTSGNQNLSGVSVTEIQDRIIEGKTTKAEVKEWLGEPSGITKDKDGNEVWNYSFSNFESQVRAETFIPIVGGLLGGSDTKQENRMLGITFKRGVVYSYTFETSNT